MREFQGADSLSSPHTSHTQWCRWWWCTRPGSTTDSPTSHTACTWCVGRGWRQAGRCSRPPASTPPVLLHPAVRCDRHNLRVPGGGGGGGRPGRRPQAPPLQEAQQGEAAGGEGCGVWSAGGAPGGRAGGAGRGRARHLPGPHRALPGALHHVIPWHGVDPWSPAACDESSSHDRLTPAMPGHTMTLIFNQRSCTSLNL